MAIFIGVLIWAGEATSYNSLVATRAVGGLSAGVVEAMGPFIVSETFPEHQLARAMVVYVGCLAAGSTIGPIFAGIIVTHLGTWRWFFRIMAIVQAVNWITCFLMLPETSFAGEWEVNGALDIEDLQRDADNKAVADSVEDVDKGELPDTPPSTIAVNTTASGFSLWKERSLFIPWHMEDISRPTDTRFGFISLVMAPLPLLLVPSVLVSTLLFGLTIGSTVIYSVVSANVLLSPPHLWSAQSVGLLPVASFIGIMIGLPVGGTLADKISLIQTRRSNGEHNPRNRLPLVIAGFLISPTGLIVSGYCLRPSHFSWIGYAVGWAMLSFGLTASSSTVTTYCVDTFRNKAGHIGVLINVIKNCIAFGVSYAAVPWYTIYGPVKEHGTMAGLLWASYLAVIPLYFYHKKHSEFSYRLLAKLGA